MERLYREFAARLVFVGLLLTTPAVLSAQSFTVSGRVTSEDGRTLAGVSVAVEGAGSGVTTGAGGRYTITSVNSGSVILQFRAAGYTTQDTVVVVSPTAALNVDVVLRSEAIPLSAIVIEGASRAIERVIDAPAAVDVVPLVVRQAVSIASQAPMALNRLAGVDLAQSGMNDFNVNMRGFNFSLNRSVLVLQDGRDLSVPLLGSQEWAALSVPVEDAARIEVIKGPGSALYGANAFSGVVNVTTPPARELIGTRLSVGGGERSTARFDFRHAGVSSNARVGYRLNLGYNRSDDWSLSRTRLDHADFIAEYAPATDSTLRSPTTERLPLKGQTRDAVTGAATGKPNALATMYGSARFDYYMANRSMVTLDGGAAQAENTVFLTSIGRVQVPKVRRPWARVAVETPHYNLSAWYSGRTASDPQLSLSSGQQIADESAVFHGEGRYQRTFLGDAGRVILGASAQDSRVNTSGTLMDPALDGRRDKSYAGYSQVEYSPVRRVRLVGAVRWDKGDLFSSRLSPKAGLVITPTGDHSVRLTVNRAFLTPSLTQFFLKTVAGAPVNFTALETGLRASPLGPALAGVPVGQLFTNSAAVPVLAFGNASLVPEAVTSYEVGYKGQLGPRLYLELDGYFSKIKDFVTSLLPATALNPAFHAWTAPAAVPASAQAQLEAAVKSALAGSTAEFGLTRLADGSTAIVVSNGNAGKVDEWGVEGEVNVEVSKGLTLSGGYALFKFDIKQQQAGDVLLPNTPTHKGTVSLSYSGRSRLSFGADARLVSGFPWAVGVYRGYVPASQTVNADLGFRISQHFRISAIGTNIFNQRRFQMFGGSVIGRRVLGGVTATF